MKKISLLSFALIFIVSGCKLPTVGYFSAQPDLRAYKTAIESGMTIVLDQIIPDTLVIKSETIKKMTVLEFRQTVEDALINTFEDSYTEVSVANSYSQKGMSLVVIKINPYWNKRSSETWVAGASGITTSRVAYDLESKFIYQAIVYSDGIKKGVVEGISFSEKSTMKKSKTPEVFMDGVRKLCEDIYKQTVAL